MSRRQNGLGEKDGEIRNFVVILLLRLTINFDFPWAVGEWSFLGFVIPFSFSLTARRRRRRYWASLFTGDH